MLDGISIPPIFTGLLGADRMVDEMRGQTLDPLMTRTPSRKTLDGKGDWGSGEMAMKCPNCGSVMDYFSERPRALMCKALTRIRHPRLKSFRPNYAFFEPFSSGDIVVDVGTGDDPDFSRLMIDRYKCECYGVDPTKKHESALRRIEEDYKQFHYLQLALGPENKTVTFYESKVNVSGSVLVTHRNIVNDPTISYEVEMVTIDALLNRIGKSTIAIIKIDIEGAEFELISSLSANSLNQVDQLIVEFHHGTVPGYARRDTRAGIKKLEGMGFMSIVYNGRDCLFYKQRP